MKLHNMKPVDQHFSLKNLDRWLLQANSAGKCFCTKQFVQCFQLLTLAKRRGIEKKCFKRKRRGGGRSMP